MDTSRLEKAFKLYETGHPDDAVEELQLMAQSTSDVNERASLLLSEHTCYLSLGRLTMRKEH